MPLLWRVITPANQPNFQQDAVSNFEMAWPGMIAGRVGRTRRCCRVASRCSDLNLNSSQHSTAASNQRLAAILRQLRQKPSEVLGEGQTLSGILYFGYGLLERGSSLDLMSEANFGRPRIHLISGICFGGHARPGERPSTLLQWSNSVPSRQHSAPSAIPRHPSRPASSLHPRT